MSVGGVVLTALKGMWGDDAGAHGAYPSSLTLMIGESIVHSLGPNSYSIIRLEY